MLPVMFCRRDVCVCVYLALQLEAVAADGTMPLSINRIETQA